MTTKLQFHFDTVSNRDRKEKAHFNSGAVRGHTMAPLLTEIRGEEASHQGLTVS